MNLNDVYDVLNKIIIDSTDYKYNADKAKTLLNFLIVIEKEQESFKHFCNASSGQVVYHYAESIMFYNAVYDYFTRIYVFLSCTDRYDNANLSFVHFDYTKLEKLKKQAENVIKTTTAKDILAAPSLYILYNNWLKIKKRDFNDISIEDSFNLVT